MRPGISLIPLMILACTSPACAEGPVQIEYRFISLSQTCQGNWRVRVTDSGEVFATRNERSCPKGVLWNGDWSTEPVTRLNTASQWLFWRKIPLDELKVLPAHLTDPGKATMGGYKEEIEITQGAEVRQIVAENVENPAVRAVRDAMRPYVR